MPNDALADLEAFTLYAETYFSAVTNRSSLEDGLSAFRAHQHDLQRLRKHLVPSIAEADRGEVSPLDADALFDRIRRGADHAAT